VPLLLELDEMVFMLVNIGGYERYALNLGVPKFLLLTPGGQYASF
jgi:hypothetical protein